MKTININNHRLGDAPKVVGIVDCPMPLARLRKFVDRGVDIFEIRADLFNRPIGAVIDYIDKIKMSAPSVPLIGTIRETDLNRADRIDWYISLAERVDIVDIELGMPKWRDVVDGISKLSPVSQKSTAIMVSEHDFNGTPDMDGLNDIVKRSIDQGAQIVKIATMANRAADVTRLMRFTEDCGVPVVTMAMGDIGKITRIIAPLFGSLFTYGYLRKSLVPGQMSALKIIGALDRS